MNKYKHLSNFNNEVVDKSLYNYESKKLSNKQRHK